MVILLAHRVILHAVVPLPLIEFPSQTFGAGYLFLGLPLDLFSNFFWWLTTLTHHVVFFTVLKVRLMMAGRVDLLWLLEQPGCDWLYPQRICIRLPQRVKSVSELCLIYKTDSNQGWWEVVGA
jgi:hypothetical protein